jgi:hypothetical protein
MNHNLKKNIDNFNVGKIGWKFIDSISTGRYKITTATGDLADNSDDANAKNFWIDFHGPSKEIEQIVFADDGDGMDYETLEGSFTLGFERKRNSKELGKFGVGGTMGCLNLASRKTTITRDESGDVIAREYDLESVKEKDCWGTAPVEVTEEMENILNSYVGKDGTGTVIILSEFNRNNFGLRKDNLIRSLVKYCSETYCEKIASREFNIEIDGNKVSPKDPLFWYHPDIGKLIDTIIPGTNYRLRMVDLTNVKEAKGRGLNDGALNDKQGGYFYRCNRLIKGAVTNNDKHWSKTWSKHPNLRFVRWAVYFDATGDKDFGIPHDKSDVSVRQNIADKIRELIVPEATIIKKLTQARASQLTKEDKNIELQEMADVLKDISKKEKIIIEKPSESEGDLFIKETVIVNPDSLVKIPSYVVKDVKMTPLAEPFVFEKNSDPSESKWILKINTDHRYISKFYLHGSKDVRSSVISWILPYALSILSCPEDEECDMIEFRQLFNRKLIQTTSKVDLS